MSNPVHDLRKGRVARRARCRAIMMVAAALVLPLGLSACTPPVVACPAIGWINELAIALEGDVSDVADVLLCVDGICVPADDGVVPDELAQVAPMSQSSTGNRWVFSTGMSTPDAFTVRVLSTDGAIRTEVEAAPDWARVGGSEQCGGPGEATVIVQV
ncbi:hypothetical protein WDU99_05905 [Microbacterium sp. Mu-80]|uniref:Secreted protein n=1 Tax=Microbacterium bandirmense TaxID=3122050 RepID=A0ABU8L948_9MICO